MLAGGLCLRGLAGLWGPRWLDGGHPPAPSPLSPAAVTETSALRKAGPARDRRPGEAPPGSAPEPDASRPASPRSRRYAWLGTAASLVIFSISTVVLWRIISEVDMAELRRAFTAASANQIGLALLFTAASYLLLTCYDALALRQLGLTVRYRTTALASFTSYAVSFTLGFPLLTAGTVRYWIYAPAGLSAGRIAALTVIAGLTFWLGLGAVLGWCLLREADALARLTYADARLSQAMGLAALGLVASYLVWVALHRRSVRIQGWRLELPGPQLSLAQMLVGAGDICTAAAVLYILLPAGHGIGFETFLAVHLMAVMLGMASHAPGGLGVFEATILLALSSLPREPVLGALLLFRIIYYLVPFVLALALLGAYEIANRIRATRGALRSDEDAR